MECFLGNRSPLKHRLKTGEKFVVSIQIDPPIISEGKEVRQAMPKFLNMLRELKLAGAEIVDINSSRGKRSRNEKEQMFLSSTHLAGLAQDKFGLESIPHVTTRDMSLAGVINEIETAYALYGVTDFLVITGDPHDYNQNFPHTGVFEVDSVGAIAELNKYLRPRNVFSIAAAVNQNDPLGEAPRLLQKIQAGTDFFMSQTIFGKGQIAPLCEFVSSRTDLPLMIGVWPPTHRSIIERIKNGGIVGVVIDDETYGESLRYEQKDDLVKWGLDRAQETIEYIRDTKSAPGVYIVAPLRNPLLVLDLWKRIK